MIDKYDRREYTTGSGRLSYSDKFVVYVYDGYHHPFYKTISLKSHWWQLSSPAEKIRRAKIKAAQIAERLNQQELYRYHEAEIAEREQ